jgi:hypothetical protein
VVATGFIEREIIRDEFEQMELNISSGREVENG